MRYTCENCCKIFHTPTKCPGCGSSKVKTIIIVNQKNTPEKLSS